MSPRTVRRPNLSLAFYSVSSSTSVFPPETQSNWKEKDHEHEDEPGESKRDADCYGENAADDPSAVGERLGGKSSDLLPVTPTSWNPEAPGAFPVPDGWRARRAV